MEPVIVISWGSPSILGLLCLPRRAMFSPSFWSDLAKAIRPRREPGEPIVVRCQSEEGDRHRHDDHQFPAPLSKPDEAGAECHSEPPKYGTVHSNERLLLAAKGDPDERMRS